MASMLSKWHKWIFFKTRRGTGCCLTLGLWNSYTTFGGDRRGGGGVWMVETSFPQFHGMSEHSHRMGCTLYNIEHNQRAGLECFVLHPLFPCSHSLPPPSSCTVSNMWALQFTDIPIMSLLYINSLILRIKTSAFSNCSYCLVTWTF